MIWTVFLVASFVKLTLLPAYRSTDFEVHRNWLAITHSLPLSKWYFENTSEWTLDYPPLFAYFEYGLSHIAKWFDPNMLIVGNLNYASDRTILFQRLSVIVTDIVYAIGVRSCLNNFNLKSLHSTLAASLLLVNFGLFIIDHIHFQYNGILFGILLISMSKMIQCKYLQSAFLFAILLNMKHIFVYASPVYIAFLLKFYCWNPGKYAQSIQNLLKLAVITLAVTIVSFGPFYDHIPQVISRLFPFKRGLCHAYWAPNFWALYNIADKLAAYALKIKSSSGLNTGGLVQEFDHVVLPSIKPFTTFALTAAFMLPCVIKIFTMKWNKDSTPKNFIRSIVICTATSFMFGWHVHEKAILMVFIPLSLLIAADKYDARNIVLLSVVANYSLLPLLFTPELLIMKISLFLFFISFTLYCASKIHSIDWQTLLPLHEKLYIIGFIFVFSYENFLQHIFGLATKFEFLPLLLTSVYCSLGITYFWLKYYFWFLALGNTSDKSSLKATKKNKKKKTK